MTTQLVRGSPESVFNAIVVEDFRHFWDVAIAVLENRDPHCDIVHVILVVSRTASLSLAFARRRSFLGQHPPAIFCLSF